MDIKLEMGEAKGSENLAAFRAALHLGLWNFLSLNHVPYRVCSCTLCPRCLY